MSTPYASNVSWMVVAVPEYYIYYYDDINPPNGPVTGRCG